MQSKKQIHAKKTILDKIVKHKSASFPTRVILQEMGLDYQTSHGVLHQLIEEDLIKFVNGQNDLVIFTESGVRAATIGYDIYINEVEEKENTRKGQEAEKDFYELAKLRFEHKTRWFVYLSMLISVVSLVISILAWYYPRS